LELFLYADDAKLFRHITCKRDADLLQKNLVMNNVTNPRSAKHRFLGVTITHDMTVKEREQCKLLVEEAKKMQNEETGNYIYRVRGPPGQMKVVKFRKH